MFRLLLIVSALIACAYARPLDEARATGEVTSKINPDGSYSYSYRTSNGIYGQEEGVGGQRVSGIYSYFSPDGTLITNSYIADENGYRPRYDLSKYLPPTNKPSPIFEDTSQLSCRTLGSCTG